MIRTLHYIFIFCGSLFIACTSHNLEFPREATITQELMPLQGITCPMQLEIKSPFLIVRNTNREDSLFHIYNLKNHELTSAFGMIGRGPNEFIAAWLLNTPFSDFLIYEIESANMVHQFGIKEDGTPVFKGAKQPNYVDGAVNAAFINDSLYVIDGQWTPNLLLLTFSDEVPRKIRQYRDPNIIYNALDPNYGRVYANDSRIVFCYDYKKQIDFMDIDLNLMKSVIFKYDVPANIAVGAEGRNTNHCYTYAHLGKYYLYASFRGATSKEYNDPSFRGTILEVFDLEGNPVIKYHLDGLAPNFFVVDEETFTLYGGRYDGEPVDHLLVYRLKGIS